MNVSLYSTALHAATTKSTSEPPTEKVQKEGPVNNDIAGLYTIWVVIFVFQVCLYRIFVGINFCGC